MVTWTTSLARGTPGTTPLPKAPKPENISYKYPLAAREDDLSGQSLVEKFFTKNNGNPDNIPYRSNQTTPLTKILYLLQIPSAAREGQHLNKECNSRQFNSCSSTV